MATLSSKVAPSGIATLAQGTLADSAVQPNDSPTFDGLTVDTDTLIVDAANNRVGVGTTTPESPLHVAGNGTIARLKGSGGDYHGLGVQCSDASATATKSFFIDTLNENGAAVANQIGQVQSDGGSNWHWSTQPAGDRTDRRQERLRIDSGGNVGIGTSTPATKLQVSGTVTATRYIVDNGAVDGGDVEFRSAGHGSWFMDSNNGELRAYKDGVERFKILSNGRVYLAQSASRGNTGYPITTPNDTVANAFRQNGYIEWSTDIGAVGTNYFTSDERKKENIIPATKQSSEVIEAIQFIEFDWKPDSGGEGHVEVGVSAQQLQTIDPRLVSTLSDDTLMVNEPALVSHMAKSLQEALTKIEALEARLDALEAG